MCKCRFIPVRVHASDASALVGNLLYQQFEKLSVDNIIIMSEIISDCPDRLKCLECQCAWDVHRGRVVKNKTKKKNIIQCYKFNKVKQTQVIVIPPIIGLTYNNTKKYSILTFFTSQCRSI